MASFRVLITRTADAAGALIEELTSAFAPSAHRLEMVCVPVRVAAFEEACLVSEELSKLREDGYDWLTFTSVNGVRGFARLASELGLTPFELAGKSRVACVGKTTAQSLKKVGFTAVFVPETQDAAHLVASWPALDAALSVLCIQGAQARPTLVEGLSQGGMRADTLTVYRMEKFPAPAPLASCTATEYRVPELPTAAVLPFLPDTQVLIATAPSLLAELYEEFRQAGGSAGAFPPLVAIGASTAAEARRLGLEHIISEYPQAPFLAKAAQTLADLHLQGSQEPTHAE